jgi:hypothetical protein
MRIWHAVDRFGKTPRHQRARKSWEALYAAGRMLPLPRVLVARDAHTSLGDPRSLPFLKDVLAAALTKAPEDLVVWTNDDITLHGHTLDWVETVDRAASMRRDGKHIGRDLFAFDVAWLVRYWNDIPDYVQGASDFDLGMAAFIRWTHGLKHSTFQNLHEDWWPAEGFPTVYEHEAHGRGAWEAGHLSSIPSTKHNRKLFRKWASKYQPTTKFSPEGVIL